MDPTELNQWSAQWATCLLRACAQGSVAIGAVWGICRLFPRLRPELRTALWWLACFKMLLSLATVGPVQLAVLPAPPPVPSPLVRSGSPAYLGPVVADTRVTLPETAPVPAIRTGNLPSARHEGLTPASVLLCCWLGGVLFLVGRFLMELRVAWRLAERAMPCEDMTIVRDVARAVGLRQLPTVRVSEQADCSFVIGLWRPCVVLSRKDLALLTASEMGALLAHELAHIQRRDLAIGILPNLVRLLFFFNPVVWLACREYDLAREAACDAAALRASGMAPADYGHLLLKLGIMPAAFGPRSGTAALGAASPYAILLRRRLEGLRALGMFSAPPPRWRSALVLAIVAGCLSLHPVRGDANVILAATQSLSKKNAGRGEARHPAVPATGNTNYRLTVAPLNAAAISPLYPVTQASPRPTDSENTKEERLMSKRLITPPVKLSTALSVAALAAIAKPVLSSAPVAQVSPIPAAPVAAPPAPAPEKVPSARYQYTFRQGNTYHTHTSSSGVASAQQALAKAQPSDCLVVDRDGRRYLVTDADVLRRVRENYAPVDRIGSQMEAQGKEMEDAGKPMEELGKLMEAQGKIMEAIGLRMEEQGKLLEASFEAGKSEAERLAIQEQMHNLQKEMQVPQREMQALSQKMKDQSAKMRPLGAKMREYGTQIRAAAKVADEGMNGILDSVFQNNQAVEQKVS